MRIGSAEWYEAHPDAPDAADLSEEREFELEAKRRGWNIEPPPRPVKWADVIEWSRQNAEKYPKNYN